MARNPDLVCVGAISGAFGVRGEVRIKSFCANPEDIENYSPLLTEDKREYPLKITRAVKGGFAANIGLRNKEDADAMRGTRLYTTRSKLPELPDDEYYQSDLIGLEVVDTGGVLLGKVKAVLNHGAGDILEIAGAGRSQPVLMPFTLEAVPTVDLAARRIIADPPDGLFDAQD